MPFHLCRGDSSRPSEDPGDGEGRNKKQDEKLLCSEDVLVTARNKNRPLGSHPQLWSHSRGEEGVLCCWGGKKSLIYGRNGNT